MSLERLALVSDVHGNLGAYEAVLADIASRGITRTVNLGDVVGKGPRGGACARLTRERCEATVRGNWETMLVRDDFPRPPDMQWWREELPARERAWLGDLPGSLDLRLSGRTVRLLHASPFDEFTWVHREPDPDTFAMMFEPTAFTGGGGRADVVAYGDIHDAYLAVRPGAMLLNTGSVGNPLDEPTPSYVILEGEPEGTAVAPFGVQFVRVPYDLEAEIAVAERAGMPQARAWGIELRTGVYRGLHARRGMR